MSDPNLTSALTILLVGMFTVFLILFLVVLSARTIILVTNRMTEDEKALIQGSTVRAVSRGNIPQDHQAVIEEVIHKLTAGKGRVIRIQNRTE